MFPIDFSCNTESIVKKALELVPDIDSIYFLYVVPLSVKELEDSVTEDYTKSAKEIDEKK
jgi:hypothetical protein